MSRGVEIAAGIALVALAVVAYLPVTEGGFVWDDDVYVENNRALRSTAGLWRIWTEIGATPQYYPLVHTTYWVEYRLWGLDPAGFHIVNLLLHAIAALLVFRILRRLYSEDHASGRALVASWIAAAVFAVHPVHVESVAWITERKNVLSGALYLAAALVLLPVLRRASGGQVCRRSAARYAIGLLMFTGALLSKTVTASLPAALLLVIWWRDGRIRRRQVGMLVPFFALGIGLGLVTVWMEQATVGAVGAEWSLSWIERCLVAGRAVWFYAGKLAWPVDLTFIYPRWVVDDRVAWQYGFPLAAAAGVAALWIGRGRLGRGPLVATLFFGGTLLPALGFFDVYPMRYSFVADHFQYLASLGPIALAAGAASIAWSRLGPRGRRGAGVALVACLAVLSTLTWRQAVNYGSRESLWRHTLHNNPGAWMAHSNLGDVLMSRSELDAALVHFEAALRIQGELPGRPDLAQAHNNVGIALVRLGRDDEALEAFRRSLEALPGYPKAQHNIGIVLRKRGLLEEAREHFAAALDGWPDYVNAHFNLANTLVLEGRIDEAMPHFEEALRLAPDRADVRDNMNTALELRQRMRRDL